MRAGAGSVLGRWSALRHSAGPVDPAELDVLWADLGTVDASALLGSWRGFAFPTGHPVERVLAACGWHGKRFRSLEEAEPLICRGPDGSLHSDTTSGKGGASLWNIEFRGEVTAAMVYDGMPVVDHFKQVDPDTLLGVMNGKAAPLSRDGHLFYFGLERA
ncbi:DUF4334 domain-containing protein [Streptomyces californicus]|uniref:DUF4334 domain-containing protein n=1 Tax=Streptomyces TaxID=1883 RepID=UPI0036939D38